MTPFRNWVHNLWLENCEERRIYGSGPKLTLEEYFQQTKWWLKQQYKQTVSKEQHDEQRYKQY
jgi:hypothetical protein